jgi:hypothetical protein
MKSVKAVGVMALVALAVIALTGASAAIAEPTGLCSTEAGKENPCESVVSHIHETSVTKGVLLTSIMNVECEILFLGDVKAEGSPLKVEGNFTYTNCGSCSVKELNGPAVLEVLKTGHETAKVTGAGQIEVVCPSISCVYEGIGLAGTAKGPLLSTQKNGEVSFPKQEVKRVSGFLCPASGFLDLTTSPLSATYIVGQMLCIAKVGGAWAEPDPNNFYRCRNRVGPGNGTWELIND